MILTSKGLIKALLLIVSVIGNRTDGKVRLNADHSLCPAAPLPNGAEKFQCSGSFCVAICEANKVPVGPMKIRCKQSKKKGLFWNKVSLDGIIKNDMIAVKIVISNYILTRTFNYTTSISVLLEILSNKINTILKAASECQGCDPSPITTDDGSMDLSCNESTTPSGKKKVKCAAKCPKKHKVLGLGRVMNFICKCTGPVSLTYHQIDLNKS